MKESDRSMLEMSICPFTLIQKSNQSDMSRTRHQPKTVSDGECKKMRERNNKGNGVVVERQ